MADATIERPRLNPAQADKITQPMGKAYAIAMLLSMVDDDFGQAGTAAMAMLDYLDATRAELAKLTEASHG